ncbi:TIGR04149 family rSAM-modified RiPP [Sphingobacterium sp. GVS05A]|uniref:TIGR04149 family rSAM-modified RiPP n=1 Tax=Sphingobacterium sp. GVS05A TaxID=2862679 RepID=UPI001CBA868F|nr:TIGR04149 family rSAM-modified RiPP [Sphingobacterium sp. GVS05A]
MKKISFKSIKPEEVLSQEELKQIIGGASGSGCVRACGVDGRGPGDACVTTDCKPGTCGYNGWPFYGCS